MEGAHKREKESPSAIPWRMEHSYSKAIVLGFDRLIQLEGLEEASHELAEIPQPLPRFMHLKA